VADRSVYVKSRECGGETRPAAWVTDLARRAGARDPDLLARQLTLLIDGGLSAGVLDGDPATPAAAKTAAQALVDAACTSAT